MLERQRFLILIALAAGVLLGWIAGAHAAPQDREEIILFEVLLPADAALEIDGFKTKERGAVRHFQTPPLRVGGEFTYTVKATYQGKEATRELHLKHGATNSLDLRSDFPAAAPVRTALAARPIPRAGGPGSQSTGRADRPKGYVKDEAAIAKNAEAFVAAFQKGDAKALAAFWTPDGDYTSSAGRYLKGREAIEKAFQAFFAQQQGLKVGIDSLALRFVTPDVAIEDGTSEVFARDGTPPSRARYTNVFVKKDGQWLLSSVREAPFEPPSNYEHLRGLEWAIGDWAGQRATGEVERLSVAWADNRNFVVANFSTTAQNIPVGSARQWIGWDPLAKRIRSWIFDAAGGFGEGSWTEDGKKWVVKTSSVLQDGKKATATFLVAPVDADTITLQATDRSVDGNRLPDSKEVKLKRVK